MVENHETDQEASKIQDLSTSKNNPRPDSMEILRRQGPEFEPPKEDITGKQQIAGQGGVQTAVNPASDSANKTRDEEAQKKKDAELVLEEEKLKQADKALKNQRLPELGKELQKIQQNKEQEAQQPNSEPDQNEDYDYGMSQ